MTTEFPGLDKLGKLFFAKHPPGCKTPFRIWLWSQTPGRKKIKQLFFCVLLNSMYFLFCFQSLLSFNILTDGLIFGFG
jgi:hypothetical protein